MSLSFTPVSEEQAMGLLSAGVYRFEVKNAEDKIGIESKKPYIKLTLQVWDKDGREHYIYDNINTGLLYKLKHFCEVAGLNENYKAGKLEAIECIGKSGSCKIKTEPAKGDFPAKNAVQDYVKSQAQVQAVNQDAFVDDAIPF